MKYSFTKEANLDQLTIQIQNSPIVTALDYMETRFGELDIYFKAELSSGDNMLLVALVAAHEPVAVIPSNLVSVKELETKTNLRGIPKVAAYEPEGDAATIVTHNFGDKTTWYEGSVMLEETLTPNEDEIFEGTKEFWINLVSGKCTDEDKVLHDNPGLYVVQVKVDGVLVPETDYTINYIDGSIEFIETVTGVVTAKYWYAVTSFFTIKPRPTKTLSIKAAKIQFSENTTLQSPFYFEAWVDHPTLGLIAVPGSRIAYKSALDFISTANRATAVKAWGELNNDVTIMPYDYARAKPIKSADNAMIRIYTKDHKPVLAELATATFYILSEPEDEIV